MPVDGACAAALFFALAGLPLTAAAQRIEIAAFVGSSHSLPRTTELGGMECDLVPCEPPHTARGAGAAIGGRLSLRLGSHFGVDATLQRAISVNEQWVGTSVFRTDVIVASASLQPYFQVSLDDFIEVAIGAGPAVVVHDVNPVGAAGDGTNGGLAISSALRGRIGRSYVELRAGYTHIIGIAPYWQVPRNHLTYGVALAHAFGR